MSECENYPVIEIIICFVRPVNVCASVCFMLMLCKPFMFRGCVTATAIVSNNMTGNEVTKKTVKNDIFNGTFTYLIRLVDH